MKLLSILLLTPIFLTAQNTEGIVTYSETVKMQIQLPEGPEGDEMRKMIPPSQTFANLLYFNEQAGLYREPEVKDESEDKEFNQEHDGMQMKIKMDRPKNRIYHDLDKGETVESREFFGRDFLIEGASKTLNWKLTGEQKKVLDYACQKAMLQDTSRSVEAWFTTQIPVALGPGEFAGLPGLILEVNVGNGNRIMTATKVELKPLEKGAMEKPKKGKSVTREEFEKIVAEKTKEMNIENGGNGGGMRVIIRN